MKFGNHDMLKRAAISAWIVAALSGCQNHSASGTFVGGDIGGAIIVRLEQNETGVVNGNIGTSLLDLQTRSIKVSARSISGTDNGTELIMVSHARNWTETDASFILSHQGSDLILRGAGATQTVLLVRSDQAEYDRRVAGLEAYLSGNNEDLLPVEE